MLAPTSDVNTTRRRRVRQPLLAVMPLVLPMHGVASDTLGAREAFAQAVVEQVRGVRGADCTFQQDTFSIACPMRPFRSPSRI